RCRRRSWRRPAPSTRRPTGSSPVWNGRGRCADTGRPRPVLPAARRPGATPAAGLSGAAPVPVPPVPSRVERQAGAGRRDLGGERRAGFPEAFPPSRPVHTGADPHHTQGRFEMVFLTGVLDAFVFSMLGSLFRHVGSQDVTTGPRARVLAGDRTGGTPWVRTRCRISVSPRSRNAST